MRVGIVGLGFVGKATAAGFLNKHKLLEVETFDTNKSTLPTCETLKELVQKTTIIFICVPTPMKADGSCDTRIVEQVIADISALLWKERYPYVFEVVIKSTVPPNTTDRLNRENENILITFNPEFLTEANYINDVLNQSRIIIGIPPERKVDVAVQSGRYVKGELRVANVYRLAFPTVPQFHMWANEAEMLKYVTNSFLALKVIFANEIAELCGNLGVSYESMVEGLRLDSRLGTSHWQVPGPDGKFGFGGTCFPKDVNAILKIAKDTHVELNVLDAAWQTNLTLRDKDWELLKGRAISADYAIKLPLDKSDVVE